MVSSLSNHQDIPDGHHVARYCKPRHVQGAQILPEAFELRKSEYYLSTNWMEYFNTNNVHQQIEYVRKAMLKMKFQLRSKGRFARLGVAKIKNSIDDLQVKSIPNRKNPSHAGIYSADIDQNGSIALELADLVQPGDVFLVGKD